MASGDVLFQSTASLYSDRVYRGTGNNFHQEVVLHVLAYEDSADEYRFTEATVTADAPDLLTGDYVYPSAFDGAKQYRLTITEV